MLFTLVGPFSYRGYEKRQTAGVFPVPTPHGQKQGITGTFFSAGLERSFGEISGFEPYTGGEVGVFIPSDEKGAYGGLRGLVGVWSGVFFLEVGHGGGFRDGSTWGMPVDYTFLSDATLGFLGPNLFLGGGAPGSARRRIRVGIRFAHFSWGRDKLSFFGLESEGPNFGFETIGVVLIIGL
jgi:hypothetical protein